MGQQEVVAGGSTAVRRMIMVLTVAALMAAMMAVSAMPAMAKNSYQLGQDSPPGPPAFSGGPGKNGSSEVFHDPEGSCVAHFGKDGRNKGKFTGGGC